MKSKSFFLPLSLSAAAALGVLSSSSASADAVAVERLVFRCTLESTSRSFSVVEKSGRLSINGAAFKAFKVRTFPDPQGDVRVFGIEGANPTDGGVHDLYLAIGTDGNPDAVTSDGDTFGCKWKATVDTGLLDALVKSSPTPAEDAVAEALAQGDALGICYEVDGNARRRPDPAFGYGLSDTQVDLGHSQWLVEITCLRGAYQGVSQMVHVNLSNRNASIVNVETWNQETAKAELGKDVVGVIGAQEGRVRVLLKGRGHADCGLASVYAPFKGDVLRLEEVRKKSACDGNPMDPSDSTLMFKKCSSLLLQ